MTITIIEGKLTIIGTHGHLTITVTSDTVAYAGALLSDGGSYYDMSGARPVATGKLGEELARLVAECEAWVA